MKIDSGQITDILYKHVQGQVLTDPETSLLDQWLSSSPANRQVFDQIREGEGIDAYLALMLDAEVTNAALALFERDTLRKTPATPVRTPNSTPGSTAGRITAARIHYFRHWRWAAAVLIIGIATAVTLSYGRWFVRPDKRDIVRVGDIPPGGNKAVLTLSDGTTITLDSAADGVLAQQGASSIEKRDKGEIVYHVKGLPDGKIMTNTMTTPRGGQYHMVLSDGTKVWLNASSSITYPTAFTGAARNISVSGEAYFEVAKDPAKPFTVDIEGRSSVRVLGTSFNINSYANEGSIKTTLFQGSVQVNASVTLRPGQQVIQAVGNPLVVSSHIDLDQVMAWKNGLFDLEGADVRTVMRQIERWYDITVRYEGKVADIHFRGKLDRGVSLSGIMKILPELGIRSRLEGRTLIIE